MDALKPVRCGIGTSCTPVANHGISFKSYHVEVIGPPKWKSSRKK